MDKYTILVINPGSTSTKIGVFENIKPIFIKNIRHKESDLEQFEEIIDQYEFRKEAILRELEHAEVQSGINIIVARGGLVKPIPSGVYEVNEKMLEDLRVGVMGKHASNLGGLIAAELASKMNIKSYIADPVVVDEMTEVAKISGHPDFHRISIFHALNQKAIARLYSHSNNLKYEDINLIVAHMGGGISVGAHQFGKVVDVNNALDGEGPFSPERSGTLPSGQLVKLSFNGNKEENEIYRMLVGEGGLMAYFGTSRVYELTERAKGDEKCSLILEAMAYQIAKTIGSMATVLKGKVQAILLTGGIANSREICDYIRSMVGFIAPVIVYPGEDELAALAHNGFNILRGNLQVQEYT